MIQKNLLQSLYRQEFSMKDIARQLRVSIHKVSYWMDRHRLLRRSISDAIYKKHNPNGDPFKIKVNLNEREIFLFGLGLGLFWGEGMKTSRTGVRLGNTDPDLILYFREFLEKVCGIQREKIKYSLQVFGDVDQKKALQFWCDKLSLQPRDLGKISLIELRGNGTYKRKNMYGVLQIACFNKKLKEIFDHFIYTFKTVFPADVAQLVEHVHGKSLSENLAQALRN